MKIQVAMGRMSLPEGGGDWAASTRLALVLLLRRRSLTTYRGDDGVGYAYCWARRYTPAVKKRLDWSERNVRQLLVFWAVALLVGLIVTPWLGIFVALSFVGAGAIAAVLIVSRRRF